MADHPGLVAGGVTIFLTTQNLEEADQLAGRIAVLDDGGIVAEGSAAELKRRVPGGHVRLHFADARDLDAAARTVGAAARDDEALTLQVPGDGTRGRCVTCSISLPGRRSRWTGCPSIPRTSMTSSWP